MRFGSLALVPVLLVAGCSLPLSRGVHNVGEVAGDTRQAAPLQVIPPGPKQGATPVEAVLGFLGAQASGDRQHAIAREFLTPATRAQWRDTTEVQVYDPDHLTVTELPGTKGGATVVQVVLVVIGRVAQDGSYVVQPQIRVTEDYQLQRVEGQWRLSQVPDGLRLTQADRQRSFVASPVYYLAPPRGDAAPHLVPDRVFLPTSTDAPSTLVGRLLRPPSQALAGSVVTAVPVGAVLRRPVSLNGAGVATVDLGGVATRPTGEAAQHLSAQLVWTLRSLGASFRGLRLLVGGTPLAVPGEKSVQDAGEWDSYDPEGLGPQPPYFFTSARRLRSSVVLPTGPATAGEVGTGQAVAVDAVAVTPDRTRVALLDGTGSGPVTVRIGPLRGTSYPVAARAVGLTSPSWGSGEHGLWLLRGGRQVVRADQGIRPVTVLGMPSGPLQSLALSRDGVRVALVASGRLYVGRVELVADQPRIAGLTEVLPALRHTSQVVWESSTQLVALGVLTRAAQVIRLAVDGSAVSTLNTAGLAPTQIAASPAGVVVLSGGRLYRSDGGPFRQDQTVPASRPTYPG